MTDLVALLGRDDVRWKYITKLIEKEEWNQIFLVTTAVNAQKFRASKACIFVIYDDQSKLPDIITRIVEQLKGKTRDFEVAVNLSAGTGKESMAVLSALIKIGVGFRLVAYTQEQGVQEL